MKLILATLITLGMFSFAVQAEEHVVIIKGFKFTPNTLTIRTGDTVRWENQDSFLHTVTIAPGEEALQQYADSMTYPEGAEGELFDARINAGKTYSQSLNVPGEYKYLCRPHAMMPTMRGATIIVED